VLTVGRRISGATAPLISFALGLIYFINLLGRDVPARAVSVPLYNWISSGIWQIDVGLLIDQLSILFVLLITGVGGLIHVYSVGYMAHDDRRRRFFAFLNLFVAAMLLLVLADNYLVLFVGWEGVGLASYLVDRLFGSTSRLLRQLPKKASWSTGVGDMGMSLAVMLMLATFGSSSFIDVKEGMPSAGSNHGVALGCCSCLRPAASRPGAAAILALGRDGGSNSGVGAHPCGHDGDGWGLSRHSEQRDLRQVLAAGHGGVVVVAR
jgi:NADH-quinone oxidoreductase subunit L